MVDAPVLFIVCPELLRVCSPSECDVIVGQRSARIDLLFPRVNLLFPYGLANCRCGDEGRSERSPRSP